MHFIRNKNVTEVRLSLEWEITLRLCLIYLRIFLYCHLVTIHWSGKGESPWVGGRKLGSAWLVLHIVQTQTSLSWMTLSVQSILLLLIISSRTASVTSWKIRWEIVMFFVRSLFIFCCFVIDSCVGDASSAISRSSWSYSDTERSEIINIQFDLLAVAQDKIFQLWFYLKIFQV